MIDRSPTPSSIWRRIAVIGNTGSGKSTLAEQLAELLGVPFVELDAINWQPNWVGLHDTDPEEFKRRMAAATAANGDLARSAAVADCVARSVALLGTVGRVEEGGFPSLVGANAALGEAGQVSVDDG